MKMTSVIAFALVAILPFPSGAQTQRDINAWIPEFSKRTEDLDAIQENLRNMSASPGILRDEYQELNLSEKYVWYYSAIASRLLQVSYIYSAMKDARDTEYVKNHFLSACQALVDHGKNTTQSLNKILPMTTNSAIREEISKARDAVSAISLMLPFNRN